MSEQREPYTVDDMTWQTTDAQRADYERARVALLAALARAAQPRHTEPDTDALLRQAGALE